MLSFMPILRCSAALNAMQLLYLQHITNVLVQQRADTSTVLSTRVFCI